MELKINGGIFDVLTSTDPNYPGIDIEFIAKEDVGLTLSRPRVVFEAPDGKIENLRILVWSDPDKEDYTHEILFSEYVERMQK